MISKCGQFVRWHWSHKARLTCDPWHESETDWHRRWKDAFPLECQEVTQVDVRTQEKHIADIKSHNGFVVEIQHSSISTEEARSRENFYKNMIWIVDARHLHGWFTLGIASSLASCASMKYHIEWWGQSKLLEKWSESTVPVYFDTLNYATEVDYDGRQWFLPSSAVVPVEKRVLWRLLDFDAGNRTGFIAPMKSATVIEAVIEGKFPPLHKCNEDEAWRFRGDMSELVGHIDEHGTKVPSVPSGFELPATHPQPDNSHPLIDHDDLPF